MTRKCCSGKTPPIHQLSDSAGQGYRDPGFGTRVGCGGRIVEAHWRATRDAPHSGVSELSWSLRLCIWPASTEPWQGKSTTSGVWPRWPTRPKSSAREGPLSGRSRRSDVRVQAWPNVCRWPDAANQTAARIVTKGKLRKALLARRAVVRQSAGRMRNSQRGPSRLARLTEGMPTGWDHQPISPAQRLLARTCDIHPEDPQSSRRQWDPRDNRESRQLFDKASDLARSFLNPSFSHRRCRDGFPNGSCYPSHLQERCSWPPVSDRPRAGIRGAGSRGKCAHSTFDMSGSLKRSLRLPLDGGVRLRAAHIREVASRPIEAMTSVRRSSMDRRASSAATYP